MKVPSSLLLAFVALFNSSLLFSASSNDVTDIQHFEEVVFEHYRDEIHGFTLQYPYHWQLKKGKVPDQVFWASDKYNQPTLRVFIRDPIEGVSVEDSGKEALKIFSAGNLSTKLRTEKPTTLGGVNARELTTHSKYPLGAGMDIQSLIISAYINSRWVLVLLTDGNANHTFPPLAQEAAYSIRFDNNE